MLLPLYDIKQHYLKKFKKNNFDKKIGFWRLYLYMILVNIYINILTYLIFLEFASFPLNFCHI